MTRPLLVILNPRNIPECMSAFAALHIDKAYVSNYTEAAIAQHAWADLLNRAPWADPLIVVSDDTIVTQRAVSTVVALAATWPGLCVTGWCPLATGHDLCNLSDNRLPPGPPQADCYKFLRCDDARAERRDLISTSFTGMALTTMSRDLWQRFPFGVYGAEHGGPGFASDYHLSYRLQQAGVPIISHRDAEIDHVKAQWNESDRTPGRELLIGRAAPQIGVVRPFPGCTNPLARTAA
jgi:hypothetical protein